MGVARRLGRLRALLGFAWARPHSTGVEKCGLSSDGLFPEHADVSGERTKDRLATRNRSTNMGVTRTADLAET